MSVLTRRPPARSHRKTADVEVGALFDEHAPMVLAICRYLLRDRQAAEDAAQETFLAAHRSLLGGTQPRDPPAWLATIARNECRRVWRTARPVPLDDASARTLLDPADIVAERADLSAVAGAIGELPPRQREALILREFCGLTYEQVAAAMSVSRPVVDSLLSRARRRLTERVGYIPRAARGALVVPASLREELARLIPGLDPAGAATAAGVAGGAGGAATLASLGSGPVAAKVAATGVAAVALALPVQATLRGDESRPAAKRPATAAQQAKDNRASALASAHVARATETPGLRELGTASPQKPPRARITKRARPPAARDDSSGPGPGSGSDSSGPGPGGEPEPSSSGPGPSAPAPVADSSNSGSGSSTGSGSSGSGSSGSGSSGSGSSGSTSSGPGSGEPVSSDSGSGSSGSGSGTSGSDSSGSGSSDSDSSDSDSIGSDSSGSGSSGSGSSGSGSGDEPDDD
jgi:RNA polymerase sigma factor (sigma-70 family)